MKDNYGDEDTKSLCQIRSDLEDITKSWDGKEVILRKEASISAS